LTGTVEALGRQRDGTAECERGEHAPQEPPVAETQLATAVVTHVNNSPPVAHCSRKTRRRASSDDGDGPVGEVEPIGAGFGRDDDVFERRPKRPAR